MTLAIKHPVKAFTLIELSLVLVIIGLIVGGVLVGRDLIAAANVRAQITQIEKYRTATNTFREKYNNHLPGDIPDPEATQFGFKARGPSPGMGDGNGIIDGAYSGNEAGWYQTGEALMFWVDLSTAHLIEDGLSIATSNGNTVSLNITLFTNPSINSYIPKAKLGNGLYVYLFSAYSTRPFQINGGKYTAHDYFGLSQVQALAYGLVTGAKGVTVAQAFAMDTKVDDGKPLSGKVTIVAAGTAGNLGEADDIQSNFYGSEPAFISSGPSSLGAITPSATTCYDNNGVSSNNPSNFNYSVTQNNGAGVNCFLSFQFDFQ